jgi:hypothetical protein
VKEQSNTIPRMSVLVPSRGRPDSILRLAEAFKQTCRDSTFLHVICDDDDPSLDAYRAVVTSLPHDFMALWRVPKQGPPGIVFPLNHVVQQVFTPEYGFYPTILGFMGDDHVPRTPGWDVLIQLSLSELQTGIVYGNDLFQGEKLPTAAFLTSNIVQKLGFMAPPALAHLYVDNFWLDLGTDINRLKYLDDVVIEHLHPGVGKAPWDQTYSECNSPNVERDRIAYTRYKDRDYHYDLKVVRSLL